MKWRSRCSVVALAALCACAAEPALAQQLANEYHESWCNVMPEELIFERRPTPGGPVWGGGYETVRRERYRDSAFVDHYKNAELIAQHAPSFARNCPAWSQPAGATTQWLTFRFSTEGFFNSGIGNHMAVFARSRALRFYGWPGYTAGFDKLLGAAIWANGWGVHSEEFVEPTAYSVLTPAQPFGSLRDRINYRFTMHATDSAFAFWIVDEDRGSALVASSYRADPFAVPDPRSRWTADGAGIVIALLCSPEGQPAGHRLSCEFEPGSPHHQQTFRMHLWDLSKGWF